MQSLFHDPSALPACSRTQSLSVISPSALPLSGNGVCKVWFAFTSKLPMQPLEWKKKKKMGACGVNGDGRRKDVSVLSHWRWRCVSHLELT